MFIVAALLFALFVVLLNVDKEVTNYGTSTKIVWIVLTFVAGFLVFLAFVFWIASLLIVRVRARQYDGYTVLVYVGMKNILVIEDEIHDSGVFNRYLYGQLPNKKQVWVSISAWDGSVKMGIGKEGDEKNLI